MKKSLVALAVLAASGVASAQSTVTLYGIVDTYFGSVKNETAGVSTRNTVVNSGGLSSSRFGFKGSEDLGGGLTANFVLEQGFQSDTGAQNEANTMFSRQAYVGLAGGFGEIKLGRPWTAYDDIQAATNPTFDSGIFGVQNLVFRSSQTYQDNPGNTIYYASPSFGGFSGAASYSLGENKAASADAGKVASFHVKYEGGPLFVGVAYQAEEDYVAGIAANLASASSDIKYTRVNASYDLGVVKLLTAYGRVKDEAPLAVAPKTTEWQLGLDFPVSGALTLSTGYARSKDDLAGGGDVKRTGFSVAGLYSLSKRTNLYAGAAASKQEFLGVSVKPRTYAVGVRHAF